MAGAEILRPRCIASPWRSSQPWFCCALVLLASDKVRAYSVFSGGMIAILPRHIFAALAFRWRGARSAKGDSPLQLCWAGGQVFTQCCRVCRGVCSAAADKRTSRVRGIPADAGDTNHGKLVIAQAMIALDRLTQELE